ncbi:hypothetical protein OrNV_gp073 [Oryctes rhinoceros nudivirus]|uniref:Uncharacterized protein n=1 Tax=Oryctes rhinoceros nudivirus TaxID=92521 RepID=A0A7D3QKR7_9VIRU|nr:hypothetical protein OrNV_gp073 [Oryctes rhinoceros nudivirus]ACH96203.1 unknown [Oryctes rhinoceros nudivirus]QKE59541.1 hypothetical protein SI_OrNV_gp073 [Oryctes rhinoceros nudivirus]UBO76488.1 hypothetical protein SI_OrNV_gp073 [Oryctes rhinoceros nudivirus]UBR58384.1 hypothetical protein [Oryctes rhinoceros nudivirus]WDA64633.1 hypothetical protein PIFADJLK_00062 [Oryctes rhinoceros nudivirus]
MDFAYTELITDEDETDVDQATVATPKAVRKRRPCATSELASSSSESESDVRAKPLKSKRGKRTSTASANKSPSPTPPDVLIASTSTAPSETAGGQTTSSTQAYNKYIRSVSNNQPLLDAVLETCPDKMILLASQNIQNYKNLEFLEWSECVLIQLCTLKKPINATNFLWKQLQLLVEKDQWSMQVVHNLKRIIGVNVTLLSILERNHAFKIKNHQLDPQESFVTKPMINYAVLRTYKLTLDVIMKPLSKNRLPVRFKKVSM